MSQQTTIRKLAELVNTPVDKLLVQLAEAGMKFSGPDQVVTSTEKMKLLGFLRRTHGKTDKPVEEEAQAAPKKITLNRRKLQEVTVSAGRSKTTVNVEVRQKRTYVKTAEDLAAERAGMASGGRVDDERAEILRKLEASKQRNLAEQQKLAEQDRARAEEIQRKRQAEQDARDRVEAERKAALEAESAPPAAAATPVSAATPNAGTGAAAVPRAPRPASAPHHPPKPAAPRSDDRNNTGNKHKTRGSHVMVAGVEDDDSTSRFAGQLHLSAADRARRSNVRGKPRGGNNGGRRQPEPSRSGGGAHGFERPTAPVVREVAIGDTITVADLAQKLALKGGDVVKALFKMGVMATITQSIDHDTAALITEELGHKPVRAGSADAEDALLAHTEDEQGEKRSRPPVVTIMGHVDHGKTSLLDYIRRTKVASGEAGGITQHIGAYHVETDRGVISFLDTPGHAAFTSMRARGAKLTDIVVLVVAADDGVMPQTIEAVKHARAAGVPLIVAVNKIDKSGADPLRVKNELLSQDVVAEEFGGDTQFVEVSAKTGTGIDTLLDAISLQAEVLELKAVFDGRASGVVIESSLDKGRGPVATVLVQQGSLKRGDYLVCGVQYGRVRALFDETGGQPAEAGPSIPVQVLGLSGVPDAGDDFVVVDDERLAKDVAQQRETKRRESRLVSSAGSRMEDIMSQLGKGEGQLSLNLVIKADVQGSVEALKQSLVALSNEQIRINVIHSGVGGITESDANSALASKATVIGFNVRADASARRIIETNGVDLRYFSIIYDVIDQVKQVASGLLGVEIREEIIGTAQVRDVFRSSKFGAVAGCMVIEGVVKRNKPIRVLRDNTVVFEGELESLRRFKENVDEVRNGTECGIGVKAYNDVKPGDQIECFERIEVQRTL
ncbi:translation initiation factor IF-2 [Xanthomonas translucens]|uniref:Translation initiation factor IF-2 n=11 Tax=Xanthomonas campestris pv. translucens TaxID=343 RepID=A0A1C3TPY2_XANCT|nr:translation initiation factor IF-2 [Xanthomonas translucens]MCC8447201.1 translation initiation factor IF-2 [Xanthomonas translucens pv. translucens]MCT8284691.1 translation initiation factor IF-2 [Xanthomonas translucens pv. translucens]MCT8302349.1 translation initiation factor IF-2 [Xanthomonas translucens pv. translucens]QSQ28786.1 translation initiation factor IF-2 [Xanthomonas translucens pv. translucens]QSQ35559.1 translation initiation factor IF-2 [Xanthomonas translucens pv. transl